MKKRIFVTIILIVIFITITVLLSINNKGNDTELGSEMAIMVQNESNNNQYDEWDSETWPDGNQYQLNTTKSNCNNTENIGDILSYSNNNMILTTNQNYRCNLYFDKKNQDPLIIESIDVSQNPGIFTLTPKVTGGKGSYIFEFLVEHGSSEAGPFTKITNYSLENKDNSFTFNVNSNGCGWYKFTVTVKDNENSQAKKEIIQWLTGHYSGGGGIPAKCFYY